LDIIVTYKQVAGKYRSTTEAQRAQRKPKFNKINKGLRA
jgi:hypothetical protein